MDEISDWVKGKPGLILNDDDEFVREVAKDELESLF
tara:strand:+ start:16117 stop:16224 length:108 start_codon:yes stop_codon:yes gene_type:complete